MKFLFGQSRRETLQEALNDPFPPPKRWGLVRVWWDETFASLAVTIAAALVVLLIAFLFQRYQPPPAQLGDENLVLMPITLGSGAELGGGGGSSAASEPATSTPVQGQESTGESTPQERDLGTVEQQNVQAITGLAKADPGEAFRTSPERLARMKGILDELEKSGQRIQELGKGKLAGIFKIDEKYKSVVFVVDRSGSMSWNSALDRVKDEMVYGLKQLKPDQEFGVIFFDDAVYTIDASFSLFKASPANVQRVEQWMQGIHPAGGTQPFPAMQLALQTKPELVILLSDGEFDPYSVGQITNANQALRDRKARIDCIGLGEVIVTLHDIAKQNGGTYKMAR